MKVAVCANLGKEEVKSAVPCLLEALSAKAEDVELCVEMQLAALLKLDKHKFKQISYEAIAEGCDLVIAFGGDGTILTTARKMGPSGVPILGVKIGGMGFLADLTPTELFNSIDSILAGEFIVSPRMALEATFASQRLPSFFALNDFVIDKGAISRVNRIETYIDGVYFNTFIGDGIIISTPTGSTAYSLAAGGPILFPAMESIIINPINPHSLGARPVVIPPESIVELKIEFAPDAVLFSADGQDSLKLTVGESIKIQKAKHCVNLVSIGTHTFHDVLRAKLNWGDDVRRKPS